MYYLLHQKQLLTSYTLTLVYAMIRIWITNLRHHCLLTIPTSTQYYLTQHYSRTNLIIFTECDTNTNNNSYPLFTTQHITSVI